MGWCEYYHTFCDDEEIEKSKKKQENNVIQNVKNVNGMKNKEEKSWVKHIKAGN